MPAPVTTRHKALTLFLLALASLSQVSSKFFAILQDSSGTASFNIFDDAGNVLQISSTHFVFPFPLIETTADPVHKQIYVIGYPKGVDGAALYVFDGELNLLSSDVSKSVQYFDLQYSAAQNTFYGIAVNGTYGRILSNFLTLGSNVSYRPIQALPCMWYVNASSYNTKHDIYYALLNNFPHQPNSTTAQKLAVGNFSSVHSSTLFADLVFLSPGAPPVIHFISFSPLDEQLYGLAQCDNQTVALVKIDYMGDSVAVYEVLGFASPYTTGPMHACASSCSSYVLYASLRHAVSGQRVFGGFGLHLGNFVPLHQYAGTDVVAATARLDW
jgi:hypothetical protein